ncbi:MAG: Rrf2 family transcriptional regulator [Oscillospiraceae bacterium]|nr:Rrf2 family transcriptional regulator [Oscillospiraceae bacterium]
MKISTKGRYGLRAMLRLVQNGGKLVSLSAIAQQENLSLNYLESIFSQMKHAQLVRSETGAQGGYRLARPAKEITAYDVLNVLEGDLSVTDKEPEMPPIRSYLTVHVWDDIDQKVEQILRETTLQELYDSQRKQ